LEREIKFEEIPERMKSDWNNYIETWRNEKIKILFISYYEIQADSLKNVLYKIYYEFSCFVGVADYRIRNESSDENTEFNIFSIDEIRMLLSKSDKLKELLQNVNLIRN
jgi:hypothetical protein